MDLLEEKLLNMLQTKTKSVVNRLIPNGEGEEIEQRTVYHKGKFYLAIKIRGKWRYFKEDSL